MTITECDQRPVTNWLQFARNDYALQVDDVFTVG